MLTRREAMMAAAGVAGAALFDVPSALSSVQPVFATAAEGFGRGSSGMRLAPRPFGLIGVQWEDPRQATVEVRVQYSDGTLSRWFDATPRHGGVAEPIWTGATQRYELRATAALTGVTVHLVAPQQSPAAAHAASLPALHAGPGQPMIIPRGIWATPACAPRRPPRFGEIALAFVHHTAGINRYGPSETAAIVQAICLFHIQVNGWDDIGYNFLVDRYGQIFEGRKGGIDEPVAGAQAGGYNTVSTGASMIGDFTSELPPPRALRALDQLIAWKLALHGVPTRGRTTVHVSPAGAAFTAYQPGQAVSLPRVAGHRDGDQTDCPGDRLYRELPALRPRIAALAGPTFELTLEVRAIRATPEGAPIASGYLRERGGAPLVGAPIEVQQRQEKGVATIARTTTTQDGTWHVSLPLRENATLRALHPVAPAVVSRAADVGIPPAITLALVERDQRGRVIVRGTATPAKRVVTVALYALHGDAPETLKSRTRAKVIGASFVASLIVSEPGRYLLAAHTSADARNVAGDSQRVALSI